MIEFKFNSNLKVADLGGGDNPVTIEGVKVTNIDVRKTPKVDIVADFEKPLPIENNTFDVVISRYLLEHISWRKIKDFIREIYRILKPDGQTMIVTANLKEQAKIIANKEWGGSDEFYESRLVFGDGNYEQNFHRCGFSPEYAERLFKEVGFQQVKVEPHPQCSTDLIIHASKVPLVLDRFTWVRQQIDKLTKDNPNAQALDVGCSDCPITWQLKNCTWVDTESYEKIAKDMQYFGRVPIPREKFVQASAENLPFEQKFDVILLTEILEHVPDPIIVLEEASRVAKKAIITCPDEFSWDVKYKPFNNPGHIRHYTEQLLKQHLKEANIKSYEFGKLDYEGWSFFTVVADLPDVKTKKFNVQEAISQEGNLLGFKKDTIEFSKEPIAQQADKLKIAIISTPFFTVPPKGYSGLEMVVFDIAQGLVNNGHDVTIFAPEGSNIEGGKVFAFGESVNAVNVNWLELEKDRMVKSIDYILNNGFQIAHGNTWFGFEYMLKSKSPNIKVTHTHHGGLNLQFWGTSKPPFKLNFIAISKWMQQVYASQGFNSIYIYNGIDIDKYKYQESKGNRLIFVGRASSFKQPHVAIEIAKKLGLGLDLVCGTFVDSQQYLEQIKSMCDSKQIVWHGDASHEEKIALLQNAKCLLFPSKMGEPYGLVAAEANCCGTSVVALRDGAIPEVVEHGTTGYICDTADEMAEAVKKVDTISPKACRERVERLFDRRVIARQYADAYKRCLSEDEW